MAIYNEILVGRFNRFLQKFLQMKGAPPTPQLSGEISPQLQLETRSSELYLQGWYFHGAYATVGAGGVGTNGSCQLRNPVGSNVIICPVRCHGAAALGGIGSMEMQFGQIATDLATIVVKKALDGRISTTSLSSAVVSYATPATGAQIGSTLITEGLTSELLPPGLPMVLAPGDALRMIDETANDPATFAYWWLERFLEESERT